MDRARSCSRGLMRRRRNESVDMGESLCQYEQPMLASDDCSMTMIDNKQDEHFMLEAIKAAQIAEENGDVPIGAVIIYENQVIGRAYNQREQLADPTAHAKIIALTQAAAFIENWRLHECTIYVTLEPCAMCAGAMVLGRLDRLVYGCDDPKAGACKSLYNIVHDQRLNHRLEVTSGVLADQCSQQLQQFFQHRRSENSQQP